MVRMVVNKNKILLASTPRSGTSYVCEILYRYFYESINMRPEDKPNTELGSMDEWKSIPETLLHESHRQISILNLDQTNIDENFVKKIFVHRLLHEKAFAFKYFNMRSNVLPLDEMIAMTVKNGYRIICLYRENLLDYLISKIVTDNVGYIDYHDSDLLFNAEYKVTEVTFANAVYTYVKLEEMMVRLHELGLINKTITYEQLTFDSTTDIKLFFDAGLRKNYIGTDKIVTPELKELILTQHPTLKDTLITEFSGSNLMINADLNYTPACLHRQK